jgi:vacuolar iron transporter family protein
LRIGRLLTLHFFVGLLLIGPVILKVASTGYRIARYYAGSAPYVRRGPPALYLRLLGPLVIGTSVAVLGTVGPAARWYDPLAAGRRVPGLRAGHRSAGRPPGWPLGSREVRPLSAEEEAVRAADPHEPHGGASASRLNWLRAGVLGANDGIVSVAGIVAGATSSRGPVFTAGLAGLVAGAVSMALGEYVSVSSQRDSETALLSQERRELAETPGPEFEELAALYQAKGLSKATARQVAKELTAHDALPPTSTPSCTSTRTTWPAPSRPRPLRRHRSPPAPCCRWWRSCCRRCPGGSGSPSVSSWPRSGPQARSAPGSAAATPRRAVLRIVIGGAVGLAFTWGIGHLFGTAIG